MHQGWTSNLQPRAPKHCFLMQLYCSCFKQPFQTVPAVLLKITPMLIVEVICFISPAPAFVWYLAFSLLLPHY